MSHQYFSSFGIIDQFKHICKIVDLCKGIPWQKNNCYDILTMQLRGKETGHKPSNL
jgi:hypothetical protein